MNKSFSRAMLAFLAILVIFPSVGLAAAASTPDMAISSIGGQAMDYAKGTSYFRIAVLLTILSFIPALVIATTAFTRIIIVLSSVRMGLGMQETPPNIVLITLALFLTSFVMMPTLGEIRTQALDPYLSGKISSTQFIERAAAPLQQFMVEHTREQDLISMEQLAGSEKDSRVESKAEMQKVQPPSLMVIVPAFMLSELRVAFQMAFMVLLPFLLIDLIISVTLMSLGMMMVPPSTISLPLKILMFVLVDGWVVLARSLVDSFTI